MESAANFKVAYIAILHDVVFAFLADLAVCAGLCHGARRHEVIVGNDLGLNELLLKVSVNNASGLRGGRALLDSPRAGFLLTCGEVSLQPQGGEACLGQGSQAGLILAYGLEQFARFVFFQLEQLGFGLCV